MRSRTCPRRRLAGVMMLLAVTSPLLAGCESDEPPQAASSSTKANGTETTNTSNIEFVELRHELGGFAMSYPKSWVRPESPDPQVVLLASEREPAENQGGSILVRLIPLETPVTSDRLAEAREATDAIVAAGNQVQLLAGPTEIEQGGLPGLHYLYTFADPMSGQRGAHSHYFLFNGKTMISMVFQVIPQSDFSRLGPLFDRVAESVRLLDNPS